MHNVHVLYEPYVNQTCKTRYLKKKRFYGLDKTFMKVSFINLGHVIIFADIVELNKMVWFQKWNE